MKNIAVLTNDELKKRRISVTKPWGITIGNLPITM